ncbi:hypothetical protein [Flavihumibacter solisilvae]|uniref:Uncharacterized protein n=1 Tax=Flavihumibacter solisilvae TaxID=1349421 RepID=A0A0C1IT13_9BACT|nr:hypothetical protein [Flavihumibacter solisilvae]KIC93554.1 hypothetical protein OI18_17615 [Flavihumibacter solisilvae]
MSQNETILSLLFRYYQQEELSDAEQQLLEDWIWESTQNQLLFDDLSNTKALEATLADFKTANADKAEEYIRQRFQLL